MSLVATSGLAGTACGNSDGPEVWSGPPGASGVGGTVSVGGSAGVAGTGGDGDGTGGTSVVVGGACSGTPVTTPKRLVRLAELQIVNSYVALLGEPARAIITMGESIPPATQRSFPPLAQGGTAIGDQQWMFQDRLGVRAMGYVGANLATLTNCGAEPADSECGRAAVLSFAERAFRRSLSSADSAGLRALWDELTTLTEGSVAEAIASGYYAVLSSPQFLYRTELGDDWSTDGQLDHYEIASELSYFITDGPPDPELLVAAAAGWLHDKAEVRAQAARLLRTPAARANLEAAMIAYFGLPSVLSVVVDADATPGIALTDRLRASMYHEGELFMTNTLWQGTLGDLVTSRRTWVNSQLAMPIYGVTVPSDDESVFSEVTLPEDRSGLLTLSPFLTAKSYGNGVSLLGRGSNVNAALACSTNPALPDPLPPNLDDIFARTSQEGLTSRQRADIHDSEPLCAGCHLMWDSFALVLEHYDAVGRYRTHDPMGNLIDLAWTTVALPDMFDRDQNGDGASDPVIVSSPPELGREFMRERPEWGGSSVFGRCMTMNFINFALADESQGSARAPFPDQPPTSCAVRAVGERFATTDRSFSALITEIAASDTLALRAKGQ